MPWVQTGNVLDFLGLDPFALFGDRRGAVIGTLGDAKHLFHFARILHMSFLPLQVYTRTIIAHASADFCHAQYF